MPHARYPVAVLRLVLVGAGPLLLGLALLAHPAYRDDALTQLLPVADRWLAVHLLQLPLVGLTGASLAALVKGLRGPAATLARGSAGAFVLFYGAMDAVAGLATGVLARRAAALPSSEQPEAARAIDALFSHPLVGGEASLLAVLATLAWLLAVLAAAAALSRGGASRTPVVVLVTAGFLFAIGHAPPFGPVALLAFAAAAVTVSLGEPHANR